MTVATGHGDNFPRQFEKCPGCGKKGYYSTAQYNRCKYCGRMRLKARKEV